MGKAVTRLLLGLVVLWLVCACAPPPTLSMRTEIGLEIPDSEEGLAGVGPLRHGKYYRATWRERRRSFESNAEKDSNSVVVVGDSIVQIWGDLDPFFPGAHVVNRGINADTSRGVLLRLRKDVLSLRPRGVVIQVGTNDVQDWAEPEVTAQNVQLILGAMRDYDCSLPVILCALFPSSANLGRPCDKIRKLNELYRELAANFPQVTFLDTWSSFADGKGDARPELFADQLHLNSKGYAQWAEILRPALMRLKLYQP